MSPSKAGRRQPLPSLKVAWRLINLEFGNSGRQSIARLDDTPWFSVFRMKTLATDFAGLKKGQSMRTYGKSQSKPTIYGVPPNVVLKNGLTII